MLLHCVQFLEFCFKSVQFLHLKEYFSERNINQRSVFPYLIMLRKHKCSEYNHNYFVVSILRAMTHIFLYIDPTDQASTVKVWVFWEGHKIWKKSSSCFWQERCVLCAQQRTCQKVDEDFQKQMLISRIIQTLTVPKSELS